VRESAASAKVRPEVTWNDCLTSAFDQTCCPIDSTLRGEGGEATNRPKPSNNVSRNRKVVTKTVRRRWNCQHRGGKALGFSRSGQHM